MPLHNIIDVFLADPIVTDYALSEFDPKRMRFAYRLQVGHGEGDESLLEEVFRIFNIEQPHDYRERSLSVGDVVTIDRRRSYRCDCTGWILLDQVVKRESGETTWEILGKCRRWLREKSRLRLRCRSRGCVVDEASECSRCFAELYSGDFLQSGFLDGLVNALSRLWAKIGRWVVHNCEHCGTRIWFAPKSTCCSEQCFRKWIPF